MAIFSVLLPIAKLIVAGVVHGSRVLPRRVAGRALKVLMVLGKWGMLDAIVMVAFVVAGGLRGLVAIREGVGLYWFVAAVLLGKAIIWMVENTFLERSAPAEARREGAHASSRLACVLASGAPVFVVAAGVCLAMGLSTDLVDVSKHLVWRFGMLGVSVDVYHYAARLSVLDGLGYLWRGDNYGMFVLSLLFVVLLPIGKVVLSGAGLEIGSVAGVVKTGAGIEEAEGALPVVPADLDEALDLVQVGVERTVRQRFEAFEEMLEVLGHGFLFLVVPDGVLDAGLHAVVGEALLLLKLLGRQLEVDEVVEIASGDAQVRMGQGPVGQIHERFDRLAEQVQILREAGHDEIVLEAVIRRLDRRDDRVDALQLAFRAHLETEEAAEER